MKVIILGKDGQLGQCLSEQFASAEHELHTTTYTTQLFAKSECDLSNFQQLHEMFLTQAPDVIVNAAAYTAVDAAEDNAQLADTLNHKAVSHLAKLCREFDSTLIHISTDYVFDGRGNTPYSESEPTGPQGVYGVTKLSGEHAVTASKCKHIVIRSAWIFSEHGSNFLKTMLRLGSDRENINVVNDQRGTPTYAQDLARAIISILPYIASDNCPWGIYHYAGNSIVSWFEFAQQIFSSAKSLGLKTPEKVSAISTSEYPTPAPRPAFSALDSKLFTQTFAIEASDWRAAVNKTLAKIIQ
mgnify:CR=1 FL=1